MLIIGFFATVVATVHGTVVEFVLSRHHGVPHLANCGADFRPVARTGSIIILGCLGKGRFDASCLMLEIEAPAASDNTATFIFSGEGVAGNYSIIGKYDADRNELMRPVGETRNQRLPPMSVLPRVTLMSDGRVDRGHRLQAKDLNP